MSRRVRPWLSRAIVPVEVCLIWFPSAKVSVVSVEKLALNGAPVTVLSPSPASKPKNRISSRPPGPCPNPWPGGGGGGGADAASCACTTAPASSRIIATPAIAKHFPLFLIASSSEKIIGPSKNPHPYQSSHWPAPPDESPAASRPGSPPCPPSRGPLRPCPQRATRKKPAPRAATPRAPPRRLPVPMDRTHTAAACKPSYIQRPQPAPRSPNHQPLAN